MKNRITFLSLFYIFVFGYILPISSQSINSQQVNLPTNEKWDAVPEEIRNTNAFKRYEWFYRTREDASGVFPKEFIQEQKNEEMKKIKTIFQKGNKLQTTSDIWTNIGPKAIDMNVPTSHIPHWGSVSGRVRGVAVHPTNPDIVYIGAASGGIWKTIDGGANWTDMSGDLNLLTFGAIAIDPNNPNTVYAGTGESRWLFNNVTFEGDGLYKSTDGGVSWLSILIGSGTQSHIADIEVSPHDPNILLAALGSGNWDHAFPTNEGVWRSTDAGLTWNRVNSNSDAFDVAFDPTPSSTKAYAATGDQSSTGGFLVSTNSGASFVQSNTGLPAATTIGRIQFDIAPSSPGTIYALIYNNVLFPSGHTTVVYKSTNFGASWTQISSGVNIAGAYDDDGSNVNDQGSYDLCLDVNPTDADDVFFGNVELSNTSNGEDITFVRKTPPTFTNPGAWDAPIHVDVHKIVFAPSDGNTIYIGCDGGIYKSSDGGSTWTHKNNDVSTIQFYRVASDNNNVNTLFGGAQDNGNFSTANKGSTDWVFETSGDGMECFVDYNNSSNVFMSTQNGSLKLSTNGGATWSNIWGGGGATAWVAPFWQHPSNSNKIFTAWNRYIIMSEDPHSTTSWVYQSSSSLPMSSTNRLTSVAHSAANINSLMAVASYYTTSPVVYSSIDGGINWSIITPTGFTGSNINRVVADPTSATTFYLCRASYTTGQVLKTTNFGATWTDISGNLPKIVHNDLFVDPANTNHLYVANDFGVYWTNDGGTVWNKLSNGMPFVPVLDFSFYINGSTRLLRAATHGRGIYELQIDTPLQKVYVDLTVFLEGPYSGANMNTAIAGSVPNNQPFNTDPWSYPGTETASITVGSDIVDWVLVELRTGDTPSTATTVVETKAALLKSDGTIVDADGFTNLNFDVPSGDYYIVIYHRNHLPIMTPTAISL